MVIMPLALFSQVDIQNVIAQWFILLHNRLLSVNKHNCCKQIHVLYAWIDTKRNMFLFTGLHPSQTSTPAPGMGPGMYYHHPFSPSQNITSDIAFSGKHNGICLYLSRILR